MARSHLGLIWYGRLGSAKPRRETTCLDKEHLEEFACASRGDTRALRGAVLKSSVRSKAEADEFVKELFGRESVQDGDKTAGSRAKEGRDADTL